MKRCDIIRSIQVRFKHMRAQDAAAVLDTVTDRMIEAIENGDKIELRCFGTFLPRRHAPKSGFNPSLRKPMDIPANTTVLYKPSPDLIRKMNG